MENLPTEVLVIIFGCLPAADIFSCIKVCRRWHEILAGHESLLSGKTCILKCSSKISKAKQLWQMISKRQPNAVVLKNAEPVVLQMLLKHHPSVPCLSVSIQIKDLKKVLRTICLFKGLRELELHVKGGSQLMEFSIDWVNTLAKLRKLIVTEVGGINTTLPRGRSVMGGFGRANNLSHLTLNYPSCLPARDPLQRLVSHLTCFEICDCCPSNKASLSFANPCTNLDMKLTDCLLQLKMVSDDKFLSLRDHFHNLRTVILSACNCSKLEFPVSLIRELRIQGSVKSKLELDKIIDLRTVHLSLQSPLPECILPSSVSELSLRDTVSHDSHWFLGLSISCANIVKLDLKGFPLKNTIAASLGMRYPRITHLNIKGCVTRHEDHMYLIGLLQDAKFLTSLSCDRPYSCQLHDLREVFPNCWISSVDYKYVTVSSHLPPESQPDTILDLEDEEFPAI